jgi:4-diphosphocytidyl-2-C-methyl-D-erythritol kinase
VNAVAVLSPAKLNLFLAVTGRRADGFHDLVSLAAPLEFGDVLRAEPAEGFHLACTGLAAPADGDNLVIRAAGAFRAASGWRGGARFTLEKRIPMGAGLGGGSSNAVAALRALNALAGDPLGEAALADVAASLGSDCPLFLHGGPVVVRGRGERVEPVPAAVAAGRLAGRSVLVFKPDFPIPTAWAYGRLAETARKGGGGYLPASEAEARLAAWMADADAPVESLLFNSMEAAAFGKFLALPALLDRLAGPLGAAVRMSGSGSACFAILGEGSPPAGRIVEAVRDAWGTSAFVVETRIAPGFRNIGIDLRGP